ncbi:MAG: helix-turn-helix domain-containing protein [Rickettsiales bacterium]|nr:helix-turn-helix domain-containing protein [Rickettsiales bacterium]
MKTIYDEQYRKLIEALKEYRAKQGITQTQLAEKLGLPQYDISKVENYVRRLDVAELDRWLEAMNVKYSIIETICAKLDS